MVTASARGFEQDAGPFPESGSRLPCTARTCCSRWVSRIPSFFLFPQGINGYGFDAKQTQVVIKGIDKQLVGTGRGETTGASRSRSRTRGRALKYSTKLSSARKARLARAASNLNSDRDRGHTVIKDMRVNRGTEQ